MACVLEQQAARLRECKGGEKETKGTESRIIRPVIQVPYLNSRKGSETK